MAAKKKTKSKTSTAAYTARLVKKGLPASLAAKATKRHFSALKKKKK